MAEMDGGVFLILTPPPQVCWSLAVLLSVARPSTPHYFSLFLAQLCERYELIMGAPLLVASH